MAWGTWYATNALAGAAHQEMSETSPGANATSSPATGWTTGLQAATVRSSFDAQTMRTWTTNAGQPDGTPVTTAGAGDCLRTTNTYSGVVGAATWTFTWAGISALGTGGAGKIYFWLLRGTNADGTGATNITTAAQTPAAATTLGTAQWTSAQTTASITGFTLNNEYIFCQLAWEITTVGAMSTQNVQMRVGDTATRLTTAATFAPTATPSLVFQPNATYYRLSRR